MHRSFLLEMWVRCMANSILKRQAAPPQALALGFAVVILIGAFLLTLPLSTTSKKGTPFIDALYTSTSAVCVTGLIVLDTPEFFSTVGQVIILMLIQIGGLGYMTMALVFPERDMGRRVAEGLVSPNILDHLEVSKGCSIVELVCPGEFVGKSIRDLGVRSKYGVTIVAIHKKGKGGEETIMNPGPNEVINLGDILVLIGRERDIHRLKLS